MPKSVWFIIVIGSGLIGFITIIFWGAETCYQEERKTPLLIKCILLIFFFSFTTMLISHFLPYKEVEVYSGPIANFQQKKFSYEYHVSAAKRTREEILNCFTSALDSVEKNYELDSSVSSVIIDNSIAEQVKVYQKVYKWKIWNFIVSSYNDTIESSKTYVIYTHN